MLWIVTLISYVWDTIQEWKLISVVKQLHGIFPEGTPFVLLDNKTADLQTGKLR